MTTEDTVEDPFALGSVIAALRDELERSHASGANHGLRFVVDGIEVELSAQVVRSKTGRAGIRFHVVEAGGSVDRSDTSVQKIKVVLKTPENYQVSSPGKPK